MRPSINTIHWRRKTMPLRDLTGHRFGRLIVQSRAPNQGRSTCWSCACDCGGSKVANSSNLLRGLTASCGCLQRERTSASTKTHGQSRTHLYVVWRNMLARCADVSDARYGGRGIAVCHEWKSSFEAFANDIGKPPSSRHTLDRIDVNGDYTKSNCRWATTIEQARNTSANRLVKFNGEHLPLVEHCERLSLSYKAVHQRLSRGWTVERALSTPIAA